MGVYVQHGSYSALTVHAKPLILLDISGSLRSLIGITLTIDSSACSNSTPVPLVLFNIAPLQLNSKHYDFNMLIKKSNKNKRLALYM